MKHTFTSPSRWQILSFAVLLAVAWAPLFAHAEPPEAIVLEAARQVAHYPVLQARVRQKVNLFGHELSGHGTYQQAMVGDRVRLRYELKMLVDDRATHLQQVNDGDYLWVRRDLFGEPRLEVIDLRRARQALSGREDVADRLAVVGGLARILYGLHDHFEFGAPREGTLGNERVWIVEGRWKGQGGQGGEALRELGPQIPQFASVVLSRESLLPLFPFRLEFSREVKGRQGGLEHQMMARIEFFEVRAGGTLDARLFTFSAGDQPFTDNTDRFVASFQ